MRGKRSKEYRKLMHKYNLSFNFREPYQVLVDAQMIQDTARFSMNLTPALERTLHGKVKPMITECSIRHLYTTETDNRPQKDQWLNISKSCERRRCGHHELETPLSTLECISSVVDPKSSKTNKHRYVVASQDSKVRALMRQIPGVPLVYVNRSVMIMEPMAESTVVAREREEKQKLRAGLRGARGGGGETGTKRKREDVEDDEGEESEVDGLDRAKALDGGARIAAEGPADGVTKKKQRKRGPKEPNPLSVKKSKKKSADEEEATKRKHLDRVAEADVTVADGAPAVVVDGDEEGKKRRRKRKHTGGKGDEVTDNTLDEPDAGALQADLE